MNGWHFNFHDDMNQILLQAHVNHGTNFLQQCSLKATHEVIQGADKTPKELTSDNVLAVPLTIPAPR